MNGRRSPVSSAVLVVAFVSILASGVGEARSQGAPQAAVKATVEKAPGQAILAAPRTARERTSIYVLLAWLWLSIAVLLWLLRLRVREADRVFHMGLDRAGRIALEKGAVAAIRFSGQISGGAGELIWLATAETLRC